MVFPIGDDNTDRRIVPVVNYVLIAINVIVFVFLQGLGANDRFTLTWAMVPEEILTGKDIQTPPERVRDPRTGQVFVLPGLQRTPGSVYLTLITSMFMHGSIMHLLGNMLFLWVFGDNIEDTLGHVRYLIFYLLCGVLASAAHILATIALEQDTFVPTLGASGAISGVLGGYILLFPMRRVTVILFHVLMQVPALLALGIWFAFQLINGLGMLGGSDQVGGVAYGAHIGGFLVGAALIKVFALGKEPDAWPRW